MEPSISIQAERLISAVEALDSIWTSAVLPVCAIFIAVMSLVFTIYYNSRQRKDAQINHLMETWNDIISSFASKPLFLNKKFTNSYPQFDSPDEKYIYDSFCFKAWGLFNQIVEGKHEKDNPEFLMICQWIVALHYTWLENNPVYFSSMKFWNRVDELCKKPIGILNVTPLPRLATSSSEGRYSSSIDWCKIAPNYHSYILGPFAPEMTAKDSTEKSRNPIVNILNEYSSEELSKLKILDLGCGPGNLIKFIKSSPSLLVGIDLSESALDIAAKAAKKNHINFDPIVGDIRALHFDNEFDIIISVNSILPDSRDEVDKILNGVRRALKADGVFYAIMPSFDTTVYLKDLWYDFYLKTYKDKSYAERCVAQLDKYKMANNESLLYADDGAHPQAYHTNTSIAEEFSKARLIVFDEPRKIYYPWELTRRFDYGYFPDAEEETWDWFVAARKKS